MGVLVVNERVMDKRLIFRTYLSHIKPYQRSVGVLIGLAVTAALLTIPIPAIYSEIIDKAIPGKDLTYVFISVGILSGLFLVEALLSYILTVYGARVRRSLRSKMRADIYSRVQRLPYERFSSYISGDLVTRLTRDLDVINGLLPSGIAEFLKNVLLIIGLVGVMLWMNWKLTLLAGTLIPLLFFAFIQMAQRLSQIAKRNFEARSRLQVALQEKFEGNREIQLAHAFSYQERSTAEVIDTSEKAVQDVEVQEAKMGVVFAFIAIISSAILWGVGGYGAIHTFMTLGEIVAFSYAFNYLYDPLSSVFDYVSDLSVEIEAMERVFELLIIKDDGDQSSRESITTNIKGKLSFKDVYFRYEDSKYVLKESSFDIYPGTAVGLVGENGSGKSTVFALILNLLKPQHGDVLIDDIPISNYDIQMLRKHIALIPQQAFLFQGSILENIVMGREVSEEQLSRACSLAGLHTLSDIYPEGLQKKLSEKGANLSGGERQKIAIARALVDDPQVLLLDEPDNHLDDVLKVSIQQGVMLAREGKTVVVITHDQSLLQGLDSIYEIQNQTIRKKEGS